MTISVIDTPQPALAAAKAHALYDQGVRHVLLYISPINLSGPKTVRRAHVDALHSAGISVGFICEGWGGSDNFTHGDINEATGHRDAAVCGDYMRDSLGAPAGVAIYPTVDNDVSAGQIASLCLPYFRSFRHSLPPEYALGAYGCGALLFALELEDAPAQSVNIDFVRYPWLSNALGWSRSHEYAATNRWAIMQQRETRLLGVDVDPDVLNPAMADHGLWLPDGAAAAPSATTTASASARMTSITMTCFGGVGDAQRSAYTNLPIDPDKPTVALPAHLSDGSRSVMVFRGDKSVSCAVDDVGPWNIRDPYWMTGARPASEAQHRAGERAQNGRVPTNPAGIDGTPGVWRALGMDPSIGITTVDWQLAPQ